MTESMYKFKICIGIYSYKYTFSSLTSLKFIKEEGHIILL